MSDYCAQQVLQLASGVWEDIGSPTAQSVGYISGVLTSSGLLGDLNSRLTTCFWISGGSCIAGGFGGEEANILSLLYQSRYMRTAGMNALAAGGWTSIKDGDSAYSREGASRTASEYREMRKQLMEQVHIAVANWKVGHTAPTSVDALPLDSWPSPT